MIGRQVLASFGTRIVAVGDGLEHGVTAFFEIRPDRLEAGDPVFGLQCFESDADDEWLAGGRCGRGGGCSGGGIRFLATSKNGTEGECQQGDRGFHRDEI
jgi:hypothetical protein